MRIALVVAATLLCSAGCPEKVPEIAPSDDTLSDRAVPVDKRAPETPSLSCTIRGKPTCALGSAPNVTVAITNQTDADTYLVGSLAGSGVKMRYPHCYFEVVGPDGESAVKEFVPEDPLVNVLRQEDFVKVRPGESFDPYDRGHRFFPAIQLHPSTFGKAQEYRIQFVYSTKNDNIAFWRGDDWGRVPADEKLKVLTIFKQVPKVEVRSNEIKVTVVEPGK
jgi:hypothetical protein